MAVISVNEIPEGDEARSDASPQTQLTRGFNVLVATGDSSEVARTGAGVPERGDVHPDNANAVCARVTVAHPEPRDFPNMYRVVAEYSTRIVGPAPSEDDESNPLAKPIVVSFRRETTAIAQEYGYGNSPEDRDQLFPLINSAFVPYDPVPTREQGIRVLAVRKNEASFDPLTLDAVYEYRVNKFPWNGYPAERVLFTGATAEQVRSATLTYFDVIYTFKIKFNDPIPGFIGWTTILTDKGRHQIASDGKMIPLTDKNGDELLIDVPLDGNGDILELDPLLPPSSQVYYNVWHTYPRADFSGLNITLP